MEKLSIIIPVFNEEKTIGVVLEEINRLTIPDVQKEIIVVDDGSTDQTVAKVKSQLKNNKEITFISHGKNQGKGSAVKTGIKYTKGDYIIIQDADLEYNPDDIRRLVKFVKDGKAQVVYGTRLKRLPNLSRDEKNPLFLLHYFGNRLLSFLTSVLYGTWITDMETGYKLFPKKAVEDIKLHARGFDFEPEITTKILKQGYKIYEIPIKTSPRGYNQGKKLNTIKDGLIAFFTIFKYRFIN